MGTTLLNRAFNRFIQRVDGGFELLHIQSRIAFIDPNDSGESRRDVERVLQMSTADEYTIGCLVEDDRVLPAEDSALKRVSPSYKVLFSYEPTSLAVQCFYLSPGHPLPGGEHRPTESALRPAAVVSQPRLHAVVFLHTASADACSRLLRQPAGQFRPPVLHLSLPEDQ